jgi:hypothetical protein
MPGSSPLCYLGIRGSKEDPKRRNRGAIEVSKVFGFKFYVLSFKLPRWLAAYSLQLAAYSLYFRIAQDCEKFLSL